MDKKSFLDLLDRYQQNRCTAEENLLVENWFASLDDENTKNLSQEELAVISTRVLSKLPHHSNASVKNLSIHHLTWYKVAAAAVIGIAVLWAGLYTFNTNRAERSFKNENEGTELITQTNTSDQEQRIELSDHSVVTLQPSSTITFPKNFTGNRRPIYLKGNAFFSVSKNREKPFYVYNNNLVVRVVGTSFFIRTAQLGTKAQVDVRTGKVQVNENTDRSILTSLFSKRTNGVFVTPNQRAVFDETNHEIKTGLVDHPVILENQDTGKQANRFKFSETSLREVLCTLCKAYNIDIKAEDAGLYNCTFTGDIDQKGLYEQLNLICQSISGSFQINGTHILIKGKKCN